MYDNKVLLTLLVTSFLILTGCKTRPVKRVQDLSLNIPGQWTSNPNASQQSLQPWLNDFDDPVLKQLVAEAIRHNYDLKAAAARIEAARATARIDGAGRLPEISSAVSASRSQRTSTGGFRITQPRNNRFDLIFSFGWELDIWGKLKNQHRAALLNYQATIDEYEAARLSLAANTAKLWFRAIFEKRLASLAKQQVASLQKSLESVESGYLRGIKQSEDVLLLRRDLKEAISRKSAVDRQLTATMRTLEVLLGRYPDAAIKLSTQLPTIKQDVPVGLPSTLISRRPDVLAAEKKLAASIEKYSVDQKNRLPSISLTASGGTSTDELKNLLNHDFLVWSLLTNLTQPIYQGGQLKARADLSLSKNHETFFAYAKTLLNAFREVETTLSAEKFYHTQILSLRVALDATRAVEITVQQKYQNGLTDALAFQAARRQTFSAESAWVERAGQRLENRLDLYLALGGNFADADKTVNKDQP